MRVEIGQREYQGGENHFFFAEARNFLLFGPALNITLRSFNKVVSKTAFRMG